MRVLGVVAEYDPFHLGHAYHLRQARQQSQVDYVVVVMSGCFTQRGAPALLPVGVRVQAALRNGADAVLLLPAMWSVRDAEHFALAGVSILHDLGVDAISFGAENADIDALQAVAGRLENQDASFAELLQTKLKSGMPHPAALAETLEQFVPGAERLLSSPNNTLAVCYLRALQRLEWKPAVYPIRRAGDYHASNLEQMPSATAVRNAILQGSWHQAIEAVPVTERAVVEGLARRCNLHRPETLDMPLLSRLRTMTRDEYESLPGISEGIEDRLWSAAQKFCTRQQVLDGASSRRYPRARLNRLCTQALLGITQTDIESCNLPDAAILLGARRDAGPLLRHLGAGKIPLLGRAADYPMHCRWMQIERTAWDLWSLGAGLPSGGLLRQGVIHEEG